MDEHAMNLRLSRISTLWSQIVQAHAGQASGVTAAQQALMQRYAGAVYRYLVAMVRDPDVAEDLAQDFAVRFLRGDFRRADPDRGRFRDFVKMALRHLVADHHRRHRVRPRRLSDEAPEQEDLSTNPREF